MKKNNDNRKRGKAALSGGAIFVLCIFTTLVSCELINGPDLAAPEAISATTEELDKIVLSWDEIEKADIYYIYRSGSEDGDFEYYGFTYAGTFTDTKIAPEIPYWYTVTASDLETDNESPRSDPVEGNSDHEYAWSQAVTAGTGAARQRLTLDTAPDSLSEIGTAPAYLGYAADDETGSITVSKYNPTTGAFDPLSGAVGTTDVDLPRTFDIRAYNDTVYLAYSDKGLGGKVTVQSYTATAGTWQIIGEEGFSSGTDARYVSVDIDPGTGTVYVGYIDSSGFEVRNSGDLFASAPITSADPDTSALIEFDGASLRYAYEDEDTNTIEAASTAAATGVNLRDGYIDFTAGSPSEMYIAYYTDKLYVKRFNGSDWSTDLTPPGISASISSASVSLAYWDLDPTDGDPGDLYLYYSDDGGGFGAAGIVKKYDGSDWTTLPGSEDTESIATAPTEIELETYRNIVYASYLTAGVAQMRVWE